MRRDHGHACRSTARSSSAKASATKRRCSTSAKRSAWRTRCAARGPPARIRRSTSPSIRSRAPTCARPARRTRSPCSRRRTRGGLLHAPDLYMEKLVVGPSSKDHVSLDAPVAREPEGDRQLSRPHVDDLVVIVLDRPRHEKLIDDIRATGARIRLIGDGDLSAGITAAVVGSGVHAVMGTGGAPEGVLDGGGDALPERRDLRAAGRQQARARRALPRDGHHRFQEDLSLEGSRARRRRSSLPPPASPTAR